MMQCIHAYIIVYHVFQWMISKEVKDSAESSVDVEYHKNIFCTVLRKIFNYAHIKHKIYLV